MARTSASDADYLGSSPSTSVFKKETTMFKVISVDEASLEYECDCGEIFWASAVEGRNVEMCGNCKILHTVCPKCGLQQECKKES